MKLIAVERQRKDRFQAIRNCDLLAEECEDWREFSLQQTKSVNDYK